MAFVLALLNRNAYAINKTLNKFVTFPSLQLGYGNKTGIKELGSAADLRK